MLLKYAILTLNGDWNYSHNILMTFGSRESLQHKCKILADLQTPYITFERRLRKDGRFLWHPTETRFFDGQRARGCTTSVKFDELSTEEKKDVVTQMMRAQPFE